MATSVGAAANGDGATNGGVSGRPVEEPMGDVPAIVIPVYSDQSKDDGSRMVPKRSRKVQSNIFISMHDIPDKDNCYLMLASEFAPLDKWLDVAHAYRRSGRLDEAISFLEDLTQGKNSHWRDSHSKGWGVIAERLCGGRATWPRTSCSQLLTFVPRTGMNTSPVLQKWTSTTQRISATEKSCG